MVYDMNIERLINIGYDIYIEIFVGREYERRIRSLDSRGHDIY